MEKTTGNIASQLDKAWQSYFRELQRKCWHEHYPCALNDVGHAINHLEQLINPCGIIQDALTDLRAIYDALDDCKSDYK